MTLDPKLLLENHFCGLQLWTTRTGSGGEHYHSESPLEPLQILEEHTNNIQISLRSDGDRYNTVDRINALDLRWRSKKF